MHCHLPYSSRPVPQKKHFYRNFQILIKFYYQNELETHERYDFSRHCPNKFVINTTCRHKIKQIVSADNNANILYIVCRKKASFLQQTYHKTLSTKKRRDWKTAKRISFWLIFNFFFVLSNCWKPKRRSKKKSFYFIFRDFHQFFSLFRKIKNEWDFLCFWIFFGDSIYAPVIRFFKK